ncbi:MAG: hypothetical protein AABN34_26390 [Acidobacteriota bacterium]
MATLTIQDAQQQPSEADCELETKFRQLTDQWYEETRFLSSTSEIVSKETYYQIIALGRRVIPLILRELQERGGHWFLALRALTKEDPVNPKDRGNRRRMTQAWLDWGKNHNQI